MGRDKILEDYQKVWRRVNAGGKEQPPKKWWELRGKRTDNEVIELLCDALGPSYPRHVVGFVCRLSQVQNEGNRAAHPRDRELIKAAVRREAAQLSELTQIKELYLFTFEEPLEL